MNNRRQIMRLAVGLVPVMLILFFVSAAGALALVGLDHKPSISASQTAIYLPAATGNTRTAGYVEWTRSAPASPEGLRFAAVSQDIHNVTSQAAVNLSGQTMPDDVAWVAAPSISSLDSAGLMPVPDLKKGDDATQPLVAGSVASQGDDLNIDAIQDAARWAGSWGVSLNPTPGSWQADPCADGGRSGGCKPIEGNETPRVAAVSVTINEIRIDQPDPDPPAPAYGEDDPQEYFELAGPPGTSLDGLTYLVIGDDQPGTNTGVIEAVVDLSGQSIPLSGYFVAAEDSFTLGTADLVTVLNFEDSDNVTHLLVSNFTGVLGEDLDVGDPGDGVLDITPWDEIVDLIALIEEDPPTQTEFYYLTPEHQNKVGPMPGNIVPSHAFLCPGGWVGDLDPVGVYDTPGAANNCGAAPVIDVDQASVTVDEGQTAANGGTVSDADGDPLTLSASVGTVVKNDGTWSWTFPTADGPQSQTVTVSADDGRSVISQVSFDLTINNVPPTADAGPDQTVFRNDVVSLSGTWTDPAGSFDDLYSWSWDLDGNGTPDNSGSASYGDTITESTSFAVEGSYTLLFRVTDKDGGTGSDSLLIEVLNRPPVANDDSYNTNGNTVLNVPAPGVLANDTDADGDSLTAVLDTSTGDGMLTLHGDGSFDYTPDTAFCDQDSFTYHANDGQDDSNVAMVTIDVICNHPPVIDVDQASVTVDEGQTAANSGPVSDADGDLVTLSATMGTVVKNDGTWSWSFATSDGPQSQTVTVIADDGRGGISQVSFDLIVNNVPPTADAGPDQTVFRNDVVSLSGTWTDPAASLDNPYSWSWDLDGDNAPDSTGTAPYGTSIPETVSFALEGVYPMTFGVTDKDGGTDSDSLLVEVLNRPPDCSEARPSVDIIWPPDHQFVTISVLGVTDPEGDAIMITIDSIFQDEPVDTFGDGSFTPDGQGVGTSTAEVRAERAGSKKVPGNGRVYHIGFTADDGHGGTCSTEVQVGVPGDQGHREDPVDDGPLHDSTVAEPHGKNPD